MPYFLGAIFGSLEASRKTNFPTFELGSSTFALVHDNRSNYISVGFRKDNNDSVVLNGKIKIQTFSGIQENDFKNSRFVEGLSGKKKIATRQSFADWVEKDVSHFFGK